MSLVIVGLLVILTAALLIFILGWMLDRRAFFHPRRFNALQKMKKARTSAIEQGIFRHVVMGQKFYSAGYPGLGFLPFSSLSWFGRSDSMADGGQQISAGSSPLFLMARQVLEGSYQGGFSTALQTQSPIIVPGLTSLSYTAGLMPILLSRTHGSLSLFGDYGPEAALWADSVSDENAHVFAAAGTLAAQAVLYLMIQDVLIGEEIFAVPADLSPTPFNLASLQTQDVLRVLLILALILGAVLKLTGVL